MRYYKLKSVVAVILVLAILTVIAGCTDHKTQDETSLDVILNETAQLLLENTASPVCGSVNGDWVAFGLSRWGGEVPQDWFDSYYEAVESHVQACDGVLHERKYTEYSRLILALTAIGKDPKNVAGYNLLLPLANFEKTVFQGINGAIFALLALDSGNYAIPEITSEGTQATQEMYVDCILSKELPDGGWSLGAGEAEVDLTAMALQALAKYKDRQDVAEAIEKGLNILSVRQNENGGYTAYQVESSESISQTIVALSELGISLDDSRFVKNGNSLLDALLRFRQEDGGFSHLLDGKTDPLATEQAFYALVAADRVAKGNNSLYNMQG